MLKKVVSTVLTLLCVVGLSGSAFGSTHEDDSGFVRYQTLNEHEKIVYDFFTSINTGNWDDWVSFYTPAVRDFYSDFVHNPKNLEQNKGILTVRSSNIVSIEKINNSYAPKFHELAEYMESEDDYEVYLVGADLGVHQQTEYFYEGVNYKLVVLVNNNGLWEVGGQSGAPVEVLLESDGPSVEKAIDAYAERVFGQSVQTYGVGYGLLEPGSIPDKIKVANANGTEVYNADFDEFVKNATQNEIGNMGFHANAVKAQAMAVKMCGWWCKAAQYRDSIGADIQYGDVAYVNGTTVNQSVKDAYSAISDYKMVSDSGSGSKLFFASYFAGKKDSTGKGTGRLRQYGAEYLATSASYKYDWKQILHYYYDNSKYNNPSVGTVQIIDN